MAGLSRYTWNVYANMLYLEHGVGVGFSYSNGGDVQVIVTTRHQRDDV